MDYLLAFTALGLAAVFARPFSKNKKAGYIAGSIIAGLCRFLCSFLSGWILWGSYAPEGMSPVYYSLVYNGAYMIPDIIILAIVIGILAFSVPKIFLVEK